MKIELWPVDRLIPYENNVKKHPPEQVKKLAQAIKTFGWSGNPIVVDDAGVIIQGHGRRLAAIELGLEQVPVLQRGDLNDERVKALRLSDNRTAISDLDMNLLREEMAQFEDLDLLKGVFDDKELDFTMADLGEMNDGAFIEDLDGAVSKQTKDTEAKVAELQEKQRVVEIAEAFGLGLDDKEFVIFDKLELQVKQGDVVYITGQSGSGKSLLLRELALQMSRGRQAGRQPGSGRARQHQDAHRPDRHVDQRRLRCSRSPA
jgi:ABC-type glutathione transport system ATPase component